MDYEKLRKLLEQYPPEMNPGERAAAYARGEEVDHLPYSLLGADPAIAEIFGCTTSQMDHDFDTLCEIIRRKEEDFGLAGLNVGLGLRTLGAALGSTLYIPEHGIDYVKTYVLTDYTDFTRMTDANPYSNNILTPLLELARMLKERFPNMPLSTGVTGPISNAAAIRPLDSILRDTRKHPDQLKLLLDLTVDCSLRWVEVFCREFGPTGVGFSDPVTCMDILSKKQFDEFSLPYLTRLIHGLEDITGVKPGAHICGKTSPIWTDLADAGLVSLSLDNCENLAAAKIAVGDRMALAGNVAPVDVMKDGTIDDVISACITCIRQCGDNPLGFTLDAGCQVPLGTPRQNIEAFIYAVRRYGRSARKGQMPKGMQGLYE